MKEENNVQKCLGGGYVSSQDGSCSHINCDCEKIPIRRTWSQHLLLVWQWQLMEVAWHLMGMAPPFWVILDRLDCYIFGRRSFFDIDVVF